MTGHQLANATRDVAVVFCSDAEKRGVVPIDPRGQPKQPVGGGSLRKRAHRGAEGAYPAIGVPLDQYEFDVWVRHVGGDHAWGQIATDFGDGLVYC